MIRKYRYLRKKTQRDMATLLIFEHMATPEMIQARDATIPAVLAWDEDLHPAEERRWGPVSSAHPAMVLNFLKEHPDKTPSEIASESGLDRNCVSRACGTLLKQGKLDRNSTYTTYRSGLTIWRYCLPA